MTSAPLVDARGLLCPLPVLRLRKALLACRPGDRLRLLASDPMAVVDVPHFCAQAGHAMIAAHDHDDGLHEFIVERGPDRPAGRDDAPETD
ncbi:sulfurtransferase TusA family protein [Paracoccus sp. Z330]|uniref:Sulfurtransferase TusA family protein n=1 Tax=Paracoccus onchidii TaxID=3017813 RepID=A0ABT4ZI01_9RHOB|nr:sulfurtransferase TusA family protein [Paracoccus onchidii]MDB6178941.1 sulfurtransferase TusA family protein [Paracoccus onchidii]